MTEKKIYYMRMVVLFLASLTFFSCKKIFSPNYDSYEKSSHDSITYNPDWTFTSHGKADQDYSIVFPQGSVNLIEISMTTIQWSSIRANMRLLFGNDFGIGTGGVGVGGGGFPDKEPDYVDVLLKFNGKVWKNVGFRLKGNSSLQRAWTSGIYKLPFRLNFDKFEDTYPGIKNQHFYGFKELSFSSAFLFQPSSAT